MRMGRLNFLEIFGRAAFATGEIFGMIYFFLATYIIVRRNIWRRDKELKSLRIYKPAISMRL